MAQVKKQRSKIVCVNCDGEFTVLAFEPALYCCLCGESIEEVRTNMTLDTLDEREDYGEDPWDEFGEEEDDGYYRGTEDDD